MGILKTIYNWLELRLQLEAPIKDAALHPVPRNTASWWYVFGSAAFTLLILQVVTGILLALVYVPSAGQAWSSLNVLNHQLDLGWFLRAIHGWGSNFMVAVVLIHMAQVFLFGSYKYPRELTWIVGVFLLLMTLGMAFTGQVLRFDQDAYWGLGIGASITSRIPFVGGSLVHLLLGGPIIAGATLSRFFALHVFVIPGMLLAFAGLHVWMVLKLGINEWPMPGRVVRRSTYLHEYKRPDSQERHSLCPRRPLEGRVLLRCHFGRRGRLRLGLRPVRPQRTARSNNCPNRSQAGFLLSLDLRGSGLPTPIDGDALHSDCADRGHRDSVGAAVLRVGRREELASAARRHPCSDHRGCYMGSADAPRFLHSLEPAHGCMERRSCSSEILANGHSAGPAGRCSLPGQTVQELSRDRRSWRGSWACS